MAVVIQSNT